MSTVKVTFGYADGDADVFAEHVTLADGMLLDGDHVIGQLAIEDGRVVIADAGGKPAGYVTIAPDPEGPVPS